jgi:NADPH:quinone reductase-like Zn-dependent oxidoreductase
MKAIRAHRFGGPEVLSVDEVERPKPRRGEVLVRVLATSVNPIDWKLREGLMKDVPLPFIPGGDFSGTVEELGEGVTDLAPGDDVYGCVPGSTGAEAEYVSVPVWAIARKPRSLDHVLAASVPLAAMTAWQAVVENAKVAASERVLVLGASGGVGRFADAFAKEAGAYVLGTASKENLELVRSFGVDRPIDYESERLEDVAQGVDACIDLVGGAFQARGIACVKDGGRIVSTVKAPSPDVLGARNIRGAYFRQRPNADQLREIARRIDGGALRISVARVLPLERASEAEELNRRQEVTGKIVLRVAA